MIKLQRFPMEQIYLKCVRVIELDEGIDNTKTEDIDISKTEDIDISKTEGIDNTKTEDIDISKTGDIDVSKTEDIYISKTEDIDISKTEDIDISKTEDIDNTKTEDKDEDTDRDMLIRVFRYSKQGRGKKMVIGKGDKLSGSFGITVMYQNYVKSGYILMVNMHTQGLKSFAHILESCFLLGNIKQLHQQITQTPT